MIDVEELLQVCAQDVLGDQRLELATTSMSSDDMVTWHFGTSNVVLQIKNAHNVANQSVWPALVDICSHILECDRLWSHARAEEAVAR